MKTTWILIANASQARLFKREKHQSNLELIEEFVHPESREHVADLITDSAGRYTKSVGRSPRSALEEPNTIKHMEAQRFAHILAKSLDKGRLQNLYHNLVLIAPSHFQGMLNKSCNNQIKNKIVSTLDKDYTKVRSQDLKKYLNGKLDHQNAA